MTTCDKNVKTNQQLKKKLKNLATFGYAWLLLEFWHFGQKNSKASKGAAFTIFVIFHYVLMFVWQFLIFCSCCQNVRRTVKDCFEARRSNFNQSQYKAAALRIAFWSCFNRSIRGKKKEKNLLSTKFNWLMFLFQLLKFRMGFPKLWRSIGCTELQRKLEQYPHGMSIDNTFKHGWKMKLHLKICWNSLIQHLHVGAAVVGALAVRGLQALSALT